MVRIRNLDTNNVREVKTIDVKQLNDLKKQRDTLIDDIAVLRANNKRLERENKKLDETVDTCCEEYNRLGERSKSLEQENKALRLQANTYFDEWQESEKQRNEFVSYVNLYTILTDHIRLKAENNPNVDRYIALVNYIDRLEKERSR